MELPKSVPMQAAKATDTIRLRHWTQWTLVAFCLFLILYRLETPCNAVHNTLNSMEHARAEFHLNSAAQQHLQDKQPWQQQQQQTALPADPDWCSTKPRDISSWVTAAAAQPPFHFPKIIHQTVEDKWNISCEVLECMQTWVDKNPGYEHRLYDAKDREEFISQHYPEVLTVYRTLSTNVERADMWRYLALHHYGGVYADSDVRCIKPISEWNAINSHDADLLLGVVYIENHMVARVNNFILAAMPCHPVMAAMPFTTMSRIAAAGLANRSVGGEKGEALSEAVIGRTGPAALTATIAAFAKRLGAEWPVNGTAGATGSAAGNLVATVRLMPRNILTMGWETAEQKISCEEALKMNPGAYICHQYFGTWKAKYSHRPSLSFDDRCLYWGLKGKERPPPPPPPEEALVDWLAGGMFGADEMMLGGTNGASNAGYNSAGSSSSVSSTSSSSGGIDEEWWQQRQQDGPTEDDGEDDDARDSDSSAAQEWDAQQDQQ